VTDCAICTRHHVDAEGRCQGCRHREADLLAVCGPCAQRVRDDLDVILAAWQAPEAVTCGSGRGNERPLPGGTEWLSWKQGADIRGTLGSWARVWHEDLSGILEAVVWPGDSPTAILQWLRHWWETFGAGHEAVAEFATEVGELAAQARRLVGDTPTGQVVLCPGLDDDCGRRLRVDVADLDSRVSCWACGTEWTARSIIARGGDGWADAEAIEHYTGTPASTLRRWAKAGKVRRRGLTYSVADVRLVEADRMARTG
jgi:hypothetical protein